MSTSHKIVVLANSIKQGDFCVAGKDCSTSEWVRPVSTMRGGALDRGQARIKNTYGTFNVKPLQIVQIDFKSHAPLPTQPENHLVSGRIWQQHFKVDRQSLEKYLDDPDHLWNYGDRNNRVASYRVQNNDNHTNSLYLIKTDRIVFRVTSGYSGNKKIVGAFEYNGVDYEFSVTDPEYCQYKSKPLGYTFTEKEKYLCLSLTDDYRGHCYKLIAAVL